MNRYRVTMSHLGLGCLELLVDARTPAEAIESFVLAQLRILRTEPWGQALLEHPLQFKVQALAKPPEKATA
jgi:hypothetical protein